MSKIVNENIRWWNKHYDAFNHGWSENTCTYRTIAYLLSYTLSFK